ncbi:MAG: benzoate/H(+) symporter BenE family transporter [Arenicellales bacterium]|nr:benzoate/H(+) symporter BenE family transporter [Arenicellales bacterium]
MLRDLSITSFVAGFIAVLVGFSSSAVIVFHAADTAGASSTEISSWLGALGLGMGLTTIGLSLYYRTPILTAWSTPGAALLVTSLSGIPLAEAIGAFLLSAVLITLSGVTGWFERLMGRLPMSLASAMLAGVLFQFGLEVFLSMKSQFVLVFSLFLVYLVGKRVFPRYTIVAVLVLGIALAWMQDLLRFDDFELALATPVFVTPSFSIATMIGIGIPLFVVTMASQNIPGIGVLKASGYNPHISPVITWTGLTTLVLAPFGGFAFNLAAITAAICMGPEAHDDTSKRYMAAVSAGVFYLILGIFGATVAALFAAFPTELVFTVAGLALLATIANSLSVAMKTPGDREPALITFLVTASGVSLFGIGAAFWGLVAGVLGLFVYGWRVEDRG